MFSHLYKHLNKTTCIYIVHFVVQWSLVAEKKECSGSEVAKGDACRGPGFYDKCMPSVQDCAMACVGVSSMIAFGTDKFGRTRCDKKGCVCSCETSAREDGSCNMRNHNGYILYKLSNTGTG